MNYLNELTPESELRFNNLVISPCYRNVILYNAILDLTTKEFDVLYFLASHPGWAFTKGQATTISTILILPIDDVTCDTITFVIHVF